MGRGPQELLPLWGRFAASRSPVLFYPCSLLTEEEWFSVECVR